MPKKYVRTNRKQQQRELKRSWRIKQPGSWKDQEYLPVEDAYRRMIAASGVF